MNSDDNRKGSTSEWHFCWNIYLQAKEFHEESHKLEQVFSAVEASLFETESLKTFKRNEINVREWSHSE